MSDETGVPSTHYTQYVHLEKGCALVYLIPATTCLKDEHIKNRLKFPLDKFLLKQKIIERNMSTQLLYFIRRTFKTDQNGKFTNNQDEKEIKDPISSTPYYQRKYSSHLCPNLSELSGVFCIS